MAPVVGARLITAATASEPRRVLVRLSMFFGLPDANYDEITLSRIE
jgi:hypothetical protein